MQTRPGFLSMSSPSRNMDAPSPSVPMYRLSYHAVCALLNLPATW